MCEMNYITVQLGCYIIRCGALMLMTKLTDTDAIIINRLHNICI